MTCAPQLRHNIDPYYLSNHITNFTVHLYLHSSRFFHIIWDPFFVLISVKAVS